MTKGDWQQIDLIPGIHPESTNGKGRRNMTKKLETKTKSLSIYRLTEELDRLIQIDDPDQETEFLIKLFSKGIKKKSERIAKYIAFLNYQSEVFKKEEVRIQARRKALENKRDRLKEFVKAAMVDTGMMKIEAGTWTFTVRESQGSVSIFDESQIPAQFVDVIQTTSIRKADIAKALKDSPNSVPGAEIVPGFALVIR